jgi:hypothetical protein
MEDIYNRPLIILAKMLVSQTYDVDANIGLFFSSTSRLE